ncbi:MAG: DEAD/DEAH box helicase family protein [Calditrichae bacterium]|nr:DEAD/DEAH box helicase family protein [Calditrichia bacterium]
MDCFPKSIQFRHPWRNYQQRVLDELASHLNDRKLHVIAPPGSGKTVLGIEAMLRIGRPTLILSPTITIRNQWIERLMTDFLQTNNRPDWISHSIHNPKFVTVSTYQGLHAVMSGMKKDPAPIESDHNPPISGSNKTKTFLTAIEKLGISTIIVDEAHHLKNEWWKSLMSFVEHIPQPHIVALTATPPYDVSYAEWQRYQDLCGEVDAEISVPELMISGDLSPHQDFIYFSTPSEAETQTIREFQNAVMQIQEEIELSPELSDLVLAHPWIQFPFKNIEAILDKPDYYSSMLIYLKHTGHLINQENIDIYQFEISDIPKLDLEWLEIFLTHIFYNDHEHYQPVDAVLSKWQKLLKQAGAIYRRKVTLQDSEIIQKALNSSVSKLDSIVSIFREEYKVLRQRLRLVILTDFIRKSDMPTFEFPDIGMKRLGVVPIFEQLRREFIDDIQICALSGSLVIIPETVFGEFEIAAIEFGIARNDFRTFPLAHDPGFLRIESFSGKQQHIVRIITHLFATGQLNIIVGTKSLLGEGWDAPAINTLILATTVGSFVLSNQMRGRAIRILKNDPEKVANIWHLVCAEKELSNGGSDFMILKRRFKAFVGISNNDPEIANGIQRMGELNLNENTVAKINQQMLAIATQRHQIRKKWTAALATGNMKANMVEEINAPKQSVRSGVGIRYLRKKAMLAGITAGSFLTTFLAYLALGGTSAEGLSVVFLMGSGLANIYLLPITARQIWHYFTSGPEPKSVELIANILLKSLFDSGFIRTPLEQLKIVIKYINSEEITCYLIGGNSHEKATFLDAVHEMLSPVDNPRYLIALLNDRKPRNNEFYTVPKILAKHKSSAENLIAYWEKEIGKARLIFTRTIEGRQYLLQARIQSLKMLRQKKIDRQRIWK